MSIAGSARPGEHTERAQVCVIGTGAGGAVTAAVLAEAGLDVVVLEQGRHRTSADFDQREDSMLPELFEDAGMRTTDDGGLTILQGRGVGGSTVHNFCYSFRAPQPILELWAEEYGVRDLDRLEPAFERVERSLEVKPILPEELSPLNRSLQRGSELLGYRGVVAQHNRTGCVRSGFCLLGCAYDAKRSMLVTYVPRAERAGARIWAECQAERIETQAGAQRVEATLLDASRRAHGRLVVEASVVVCAAGAIATPMLLQASGLEGPGEQVGRNLHLHPNVFAHGIFGEPLHAYYGIPQAYYIDEFMDLERNPRAGFALMPITWFPALGAANLPGFGARHFQYMREFAHFGGLLAMLHDQSSGTVELTSSGRPRIRYALTQGDQRQLTEGLKHCVETLWVSGAERVIVPYHTEPLELRPSDGTAAIDRRGVTAGIIPLASAHPQSTARMSEDPARGAVDSYGALHGTPGVFVADMSVFPTSLGAPPQITTAALADRTAHHILERWSEFR